MKRKFLIVFMFLSLIPLFSVESLYIDREREKDGPSKKIFVIDGKKIDISNLERINEGYLDRFIFVDPKTEKVMMIYEFQTLVNPSTKKFYLDYFRIYFYDEKTSLFLEDFLEVKTSEFINTRYEKVVDVYDNKLLLDCWISANGKDTHSRYFAVVVDINTREEIVYEIKYSQHILGLGENKIFLDDGYYLIKTKKFVEYKYVLGQARLDYSKKCILGTKNGELVIYEVETENLIHTKIYPKQYDYYQRVLDGNDFFMSEDYIYVAEDRYLCFCSPWRLLVSEADYDIYIYDRRTFKKIKKLKTNSSRPKVLK